MKKDKHGRLTPFYNATELLQKAPYLHELAHISVAEVTNIDSSNIDPKIWTRLALLIAQKRSSYDGFVIIHGTDTMAYSASALSFALKNIDKPIVFTGAQKPLEQLPSDGYNNLINALLVASQGVPDIYIVFGSKILQGNRSTKVSESDIDAFDSPMVAPRGKISLEPIMNYVYKTKRGEFDCQPTFDTGVLVIKITPGLSAKYLQAAVEVPNCKGVVLEGFGAGNLPQELLSFLKIAKNKDIPVIMMSQCPQGMTQMRLYEVGAHALSDGAIPAADMTVEATVTKLMWGLSQRCGVIATSKLFQTNLAGEVTLHA